MHSPEPPRSTCRPDQPRGALRSPSLLTYDVVVLVLACLLAPLLAIGCVLRPAWRRGLAARFGIGWPSLGPGAVLWAHGASVGEIDAIVPLVRRWRDESEGGQVVVSALTATGCDAARRALPWAEVRSFPLDLPGIPARVVRRVRPSLFLFSENELWPNTLAAFAAAGVPVVQVSGRLSAGAAAALARFPRFARDLVGLVTRFCVQAAEHRERLIALGADPRRIVITGSLKGDQEQATAPEFVAAVRALERPIVIAASTHPGEEAAVLTVRSLLAARGIAPLWILAPRHPERFAAVAELLLRQRVPFLRRSALAAADAPASIAQLSDCDVLLLDTLGELSGCYSLAHAAFVGGSLAPVGGHNLLEAARCGVPVVIGPHHATVAALAAALADGDAARVVADPPALADALAFYLERDHEQRAAIAAAARAIALRQTGSLALTWAAVREVSRLPAARATETNAEPAAPASSGAGW